MNGYHNNFSYLNNKEIYKDEKTPSSITNYYVFRKAFNDEEIDIIKSISSMYEKTKGLTPNNSDITDRSSNISWIPLDSKTEWLYKKLNKLVDIANQECWNYDLYHKTENIQFSEYKANEEGYYDWHLDLGDSSINRKISLTLQLSDSKDYTGGDLQFMTNRDVRSVPKEKGDVIIFPSYLLHKVNKVNSGTRNSLVMWRHGPSFK